MDIIEKEFGKKYEEDCKKLEMVKNECQKKVQEYDNMIKEFCKTNLEDEKYKKDIEKLLNKPLLTEYMKKVNQLDSSLFDKYIFSYFEACLCILETMIKEKKESLFYSYMFNFIHFAELNIKGLYFYHVKGFDNMKINHDVVNMYEQCEKELINIGFGQNYYRVFIQLLKNISKTVKKADIAMCYKYPLDRDYISYIINDIVKINDFNDIIWILENNKLLLLMLIDIYILGKIKRFEIVIKNCDDFKERWKKLDENK